MHLIKKSLKIEEGMMSFWKKLRGEWEDEEAVEVRNKEKVEMKEQMN